jgi:hypothetical protein
MELTAAEMNPFIDWLTENPAHYLIGRFGQAPAPVFSTDYTGIFRYYGPNWGVRGLIAADFLGVFVADDGSGSHVIVTLSATDPIGMAAQYVGGALDGLSVDAKTVCFDGGGPLPNAVEDGIIIFFLEGSYEYNLQIIIESRADPRIPDLGPYR